MYNNILAMKRNLLVLSSLVAILLGTSAFVMLDSTGISGRTGAPGETNCTSCHGGGTGTTAVSFSATPAFTGNMYVPGQTYTVSVIVTNANYSKFGFDCEILTPANANAGTMTTVLPGVKFLTFGAKKDAVHSTPKTGTGSATFSFVWVAPTSGTATIYAAGNAVNGNGSDTGDKVGTANMVLTPDLSSGVQEMSQTGFAGVVVYPNPAVSDIKMNYSLAETGEVYISLCDMQGKEVAILKNEKQEAGFHSFAAEVPASVSKGVYFVKLGVNGKSSAQRLVIIQ